MKKNYNNNERNVLVPNNDIGNKSLLNKKSARADFLFLNLLRNYIFLNVYSGVIVYVSEIFWPAGVTQVV